MTAPKVCGSCYGVREKKAPEMIVGKRMSQRYNFSYLTSA
ncbi:hypothetical protein YSA_03072 [Pseudomonas putida ND6]|uniref:Uncharacterized protein n=1 Tax=Pseudomonas putida ND6 TaxID=231023 RepID=I3USG2_PSEPU|nr:hypothetical protein YSA_03072 [Pseudomonas putida ND6]